MDMNGEAALGPALIRARAWRMVLVLVAWLGVAAAAQAQTSITFSPCCLADGTTGVAYSETVTANGTVAVQPGQQRFIALAMPEPPPVNAQQGKLPSVTATAAIGVIEHRQARRARLK